MKKSILFLIMLAVSASGCASVGTSGVSNAQSALEKIRSTATTKQDVLDAFGEPNAVFFKDGKEVYEYKYVSVYNNPASYLFLIGYFFRANRYNTSYVYVAFNEDGSIAASDAVSASGAYPPENVF